MLFTLSEIFFSRATLRLSVLVVAVAVLAVVFLSAVSWAGLSGLSGFSLCPMTTVVQAACLARSWCLVLVLVRSLSCSLASMLVMLFLLSGVAGREEEDLEGLPVLELAFCFSASALLLLMNFMASSTFLHWDLLGGFLLEGGITVFRISSTSSGFSFLSFSSLAVIFFSAGPKVAMAGEVQLADINQEISCESLSAGLPLTTRHSYKFWTSIKLLT